MKITLDFYGFRKTIDINDSAYHDGRVLFGVFPPVMKVAEELCVEKDMRLSQIAFYRTGNSNIWKAGKEDYS